MNRNILNFMKTWQTKPTRRPLLLRGARQVGKTWSVREHGKGYETFVELNLEERPDFSRPFKELFGQPDRLLEAIESLTGKRVNGKSLLFIDEIQECPEALKSLRYFKEKMPELHVIAAGSLLEFSIRNQSFPVGRIEFAYLFPLSFQEYLEAQGRGDLIEKISKMSPNNPPDNTTHQVLVDFYTRYALLGGMPEVVKTQIDGGTMDDCKDVQQVIVGTYREDFFKYASRASVNHLRAILERAPSLLGQQFKYSHISREVRSRELSKALQLMEDAGLVYRVTHSSAEGTPLAAQENPKKFKIHFVDTGLCQRLLGVEIGRFGVSTAEQNHLARGAIAEQLVAQELVTLTPPNQKPRLHYWHRESKSAKAEVDFIVEINNRIIPIEVKAGVGGSMKSLHIFMREKASYVDEGIKTSQGQWSCHDRVHSIPFYGLSQHLKGVVTKDLG